MNKYVKPSDYQRKIATDKSIEQRPYRVRLRAGIEVSIEVEARSEYDASAKALSWYGDFASGDSTVGEYYFGEDEEPEYDDNDLYWTIESLSPEEILEVVEVERDETDTTAEDSDSC